MLMSRLRRKTMASTKESDITAVPGRCMVLRSVPSPAAATSRVGIGNITPVTKPKAAT